MYTNEQNILITIALLKKYGIRKVIASPGTTNVSFVGSIQNDPFFEIYSCVDERSAAYMACGMATECGEPVVLTCTGATASRNYIPAMTEAYYRKLPILAFTATQHSGRIGQNQAQVIDRREQINDTVKFALQLPIVHSEEDRKTCIQNVNIALNELTSHGGGPVLINYETVYSNDFSVKELPDVKKVDFFSRSDPFPEIRAKKVAIFVGAHKKWSAELTAAVDEFCEKYNAAVLCDQDSGYKGKYGISGALLMSQQKDYPELSAGLLIDIGDMSGAYFGVKADEVWRVCPDGQLRQRGYDVRAVFDMEELDFFKIYNYRIAEQKETTYFDSWKKEDESLRSLIPALPFSNPWIAQECFDKIPDDSMVYLAILNTLRSWNFAPLIQNADVFTNTGGFGIDGGLSAAVGASLVGKDRLHFAVVGDLQFFYDMNSLGNRHIGNNLRVLLINNGRGTEFRNYNHRAERDFGEDADEFMAAAGHFGNKSEKLVKHFAEDLGFKYLSASNKKEFKENIDAFLSEKPADKPIVFEVFTDYRDESDAIRAMNTLQIDAKAKAKQAVKNILGEGGVSKLKHMIGK